MSYYPQSTTPYGANAQPANPQQNLQFYPSSYGPSGTVSGHTTPFQAQGYGQQQGGYGFSGTANGYGGYGVSGSMGTQGGLRTGWLAALSPEGYDGEPPLLEELGVNFGHIKTKTIAVLNPVSRIDQHIMDDSDLAGPILFCLLFGFFLLFSGKIHFGYIYGLAAMGSLVLHMILSLMSPPLDPSMAATSSSHPGSNQQIGSTHFSSTLTYSRSASVLGYCLLPLVVTSLIGVLTNLDTAFGYIVTTMAIGWCTMSASGMFCAVGRMHGMRGLVAYPLALFYAGFGIMGIFSSRGVGTLARSAGKGA
ncbi:MAG: hypothetical protein Q9162_000811 [Coniocarpon cinnabarinum]